MSPLVHRIPSDEKLPETVDVAVIGGGIIGAAAAYFLSKRKLTIALVEKGWIGGEQSSRNWGWCRQQNRDPRELPLAMKGMQLWDRLGEEIGQDLGFRRSGLVYATTLPENMAQWERWRTVARQFGVDNRMLSAAEAKAMTPGSTANWIGGVYSPTDGKAEPSLAAPVLAQGARSNGAVVLQDCAARGLDITNGKVTGVITERGLIRTNTVLCAGGAWASMFCRRHGVDLPQAGVRTTILRTKPTTDIAQGGLYTPEVAFTRRLDGGYSIAISGRGTLEVTPQGMRYAPRFIPMFRKHVKALHFGIGRSFFEGPEAIARWSLDQVSPFERIRVLDPAPDKKMAHLTLARAKALYPALANVEVAETWGAWIDSTPDATPVISQVPSLPGFFVAAGFSGHGFGLGPAAGHLAADLISGDTPLVDPQPFRYSRFSDKSDLGPPGGL
jgi:glycine/D-amino acid oxidase-like deaminating enzyme